MTLVRASSSKSTPTKSTASTSTAPVSAQQNLSNIAAKLTTLKGQVGNMSASQRETTGNALKQTQTTLNSYKSSTASAPTTINSEALNPSAKINLPEKAPVSDVGNLLASINQGLATSSNGTITSAPNGTLTPVVEPTTASTDPFKALFESATSLKSDAYKEQGTGADRLAKLEKANQLTQKQQLVNDYTGQLNTIVANRDANVLRVEGQGRGIPEAIIGGQQAQINREAAIQALPVQAQLATAQQNLEMAQSHIDKMFQIQSQDAQAQYAYKSSLIDSVFNYATGAEQRKLADIQRKEDRAYDEQKTNIAMKNDWAKTAVEYGQSALVGRIMALDPKSETFTNDLARLQGQVRKPVAATDGGGSAWELKDVNGVSSWVNKYTQEIKPAGGGAPGGGRTMSSEENARFNSTPEVTSVNNATNYYQSVKNYNDAINKYGTGEWFGRGGGALGDAYSSLVGATKDYYKLGTYDNGVERLIGLGIPSPSVWNIKSNTIGALDSALGTAKTKIEKDVNQLSATRYADTQEYISLSGNANRIINGVPLSPAPQLQGIDSRLFTGDVVPSPDGPTLLTD